MHPVTSNTLKLEVVDLTSGWEKSSIKSIWLLIGSSLSLIKSRLISIIVCCCHQRNKCDSLMKQRELSCCSFRTEGKPAARGCWCFKREARNLINGLRFLAGIIVVDACWWKRFYAFALLREGKFLTYVFIYVKEVI